MLRIKKPEVLSENILSNKGKEFSRREFINFAALMGLIQIFSHFRFTNSKHMYEYHHDENIDPDLIPYIQILENITSENAKFDLKDNSRHSLATLNIVPAAGGKVLGVSHFQKNGIFYSSLSEASIYNLQGWKFITILEGNASMPFIFRSGNRFVVAFEEDDIKNGGSHVLIRAYENENDLRQNKFIPGTECRLNKTVKMQDKTLNFKHIGTPSIESIEGLDSEILDISKVTINLRSHYFYNEETDLQCKGEVTGFDPTTWHAETDDQLNEPLKNIAHGAIGGRHTFFY